MKRKVNKTEWHAAFCAAVQLELGEYERLEFKREYRLSKQPPRADLLIIKKDKELVIDNLLGRLLGEHSMFEYKSPMDHNFDEKSLFQGLSYGYYYKYNEGVEDFTFTFIVSNKHFNLIGWVKANTKLSVARLNDGIYQVEGLALFPVRIMVTEELDNEVLVFLSHLKVGLTKDETIKISDTADEEINDTTYKYVDEFMQAVLNANLSIFSEVMEEKVMCKAVIELFRDEYDTGIAAAKKSGEEIGKAIGEEIGKEIGKEYALIDVVKNMLGQNFDIETIVKTTGFSIDKINEIKSAIAG